MRALVTGGAGFIGSHLTEALLAAGREVVVLDDLSTGQLGNLAGVAGHPRLEVVAGSVTDETLVRKLVTGADLVYHLAAAVGVRLILDRPVETIETNIMGTETILRAALEGRPRVVLASTSEVYGKNDRVPLSEDDDRLLGPTTKSRWSYACSKAIDEFLALAYHREHGLPVTIVRFFNTSDPRQTGRYGMVVPRFVRQALDGESDHRLRRRPPVPVLHGRRGHRARDDRALAGPRGGRRGVQRGDHARADDPSARRARARAGRQ